MSPKRRPAARASCLLAKSGAPGELVNQCMKLFRKMLEVRASWAHFGRRLGEVRDFVRETREVRMPVAHFSRFPAVGPVAARTLAVSRRPIQSTHALWPFPSRWPGALRTRHVSSAHPTPPLGICSTWGASAPPRCPHCLPPSSGYRLHQFAHRRPPTRGGPHARHFGRHRAA